MAREREPMSRKAKDWHEQRGRASEQAPVVRVDRVSIGEKDERGAYPVQIEGFNLHQAISPPSVFVGGVRLEQIGFHESGRAIRGVLREAPDGDRVDVDYGFARATWPAEDEEPP